MSLVQVSYSDFCKKFYDEQNSLNEIESSTERNESLNNFTDFNDANELSETPINKQKC